MILSAGLWVSFVHDRPGLRIALPEGLEAVGLEKVIEDYARTYEGTIEIVELPYEDLYDRVLEAVGCGESDLDVVLVDDPWLPILLEPPACSHGPSVEPGGLFAGAPARPSSSGPNQRGLLALDLSERDPLIQGLEGWNRRIGQGAVNRRQYAGASEDEEPVYYALPFVGNAQLFVDRTEKSEFALLVEKALAETHERGSDWSPGTDIGFALRLGRSNSIVTEFLPILAYVEGRGPHKGSRPTTAPYLALQEAGTPIPPLSENADAALKAFHELTRQFSFGGRPPDDYDVAAYVAKNMASGAILWSSWLMAIGNLPTSRDVPAHSEIAKGVPPLLGAWLLAIPRGSKNHEEAQRLLLHAMQPEQLCTAAWYGSPPPRRLQSCCPPKGLGDGLHGQSLEAHYPNLEEQLKTLEDAVPRHRSKHWKDFENKLGACLFELSTLGRIEDERSTFCALRLEVNDFITALNGPDGPQPGQATSCRHWRRRLQECAEAQ